MRASASASTDPLRRHLATLGVKPGASLDELNTSYYTLVKKFPDNPTEEDEIRIQEIRHAYQFLKRAYVPPEKKPLTALLGKRPLVPILIAAALLGVGAIVTLNYKTLRMQVVHYKTGQLVRMKDKSEPFGEIVGFEARHRFPSGAPSGAYSILRMGSREPIWVGERLVVNGMVPMEGP